MEDEKDKKYNSRIKKIKKANNVGVKRAWKKNNKMDSQKLNKMFYRLDYFAAKKTTLKMYQKF